MTKYPIAEKLPVDKSHLEHNWVDNYAWLEDLKTNPKVRDLIDSENEYYFSVNPKDSPLYNELFNELKEKVKEEDEDVPEKIEHYYYYSKTLKSCEYEVHCRKKDSLDSPEEIYFNENEWAKNHEYFDLGALELDSTHQRAIACMDTTGDEVYDTYLLNLKDNSYKRLGLDKIASDIEWANDGSCFYYLRLENNFRPYQCYRYDLASGNSELVYEESNPEFFVGLSSSKDEKYIFIESHGSITSEIYYLEAKDANTEIKIFAERKETWEYYLGHHEDKWIILSNHEEQNFAIYECSKENPSPGNWKKILSGNKDLYLSDFEILKSKLIVFERSMAQDRIRLYDWQSGVSTLVDQPEDCYYLESGDNSNYDIPYFHYTYSSMTQSAQYIRLHFDSMKKEVLKTYEVPKHYDANNYECKRIFVEARDSKKIPVSILWNKNYPLEKAKAAYLYAYGAYGSSMDCSFDRKILSLMDRGIALIQIHARGGSDLGREWYEDGKFLNKKNTFYDVNDCAHYFASQYPNLKNKLILSGGSAGGLMVGACLNLEPALYNLAILNVPFVDMINTMLDEDQALTALEYDEWGDPRQEEYFKEMLSYSPYDNIKKASYPKCLAIAGLSDPRVMYWEALKWTQKMREHTKTPENIFLYTNTSSGHGGSSGRYEYLKEVALEFSFIISHFE